MNAAAPAVTAVVVTRDRPRLLRDALASIARQTRSPLEVRIGNDGASAVDEALDALGGLPFSVTTVHDGQAARARNRVAHGARGEALAFLDDDDRWLPDHLEGLAGALRDPAVDVAYRDCAIVRERVDDAGARLDLDRRVIARDWDPEIMRRDDFIPPSSCAVRAAFFERLGGFDTAFRYSEDWDFLLRAARESIPRRVPGVTVEVRMRDSGNASAVLSEERLACLVRLAARHGLPPLVPRTFWEVAERVGEGGGAPWRDRS
jgi:glycosyltransferase involved in cell wall biosynthesis